MLAGICKISQILIDVTTILAKMYIVICNHNTASITDIIFGDCKVKKIGSPTIFQLSFPVLPLFVFSEIFFQEIQR